MKGIIVGGVFIIWSLCVLWGSLSRPAIARALLGTLFVSMGIVNTVAVLSNPLAYTDLYGDRAWVPLYREVLNGFVADHATYVVLPVAAAQVTLGLLLTLRRFEQAALVGMIAFLVAVVPLGPEVAVNLIFAAGAVVLLRQPADDQEVDREASGGAIHRATR